METFDLGDGVRASTTFTNLEGVATNPTAVVARVKAPDGTVTTPTVVSAGSGVYYTDITLNAEGYWHIRFEGTGVVIAATERKIKVRDSAFY